MGANDFNRRKAIHYSHSGPALIICNSATTSPAYSARRGDVTCEKCIDALSSGLLVEEDGGAQKALEEGKRKAAKFYRKSFQDLFRNLGFDQGKCRGCGRVIFWAIHANGKKVPYTVDGLNHFIDCSQRKMFKR